MEDELKQAVFEALGEASMCWEETPKSVFDSTKAKKVGEALWEKIVARIEKEKAK